ncbi:MAG: hypothetical protein GVY18_18360 [Bacteroidetes bacterium]|jgi:hypothetical protein|nr:hypothetical protein [Bacteroidota bacterium]
MKLSARLFLFVPFLLAALVGCDANDTTDDIDDARARWEASGVQDYEVLQRIEFICNVCDGGGTAAYARVVVRDGQVAEVEGADSAFVILTERDPDTPLAAYAVTVDALFDRIDFARDFENTQLEVTFDAELGYPHRYYRESDEGEIREEIQLRDLRPL